MKETILLTGCAGFIGSNFLHTIATRTDIKARYDFIVLDALTYAGPYLNLEPILKAHPHVTFEQVDLRDQARVESIFAKHKLAGVIHFAAESHVDRSIENPGIFLETNVLGTLNLLNASLKQHKQNAKFRFLQISTDEVYGELDFTAAAFTEETPLAPNSPYSASKASADLLVRSYQHTFGLPTLITRCSNNYGPRQFPEKFIPVMIHKAQNNQSLPVYGKGENVRDWIHVDDHNEGVWQVFTRGRIGEVYNLGGACEQKNIAVAKLILSLLDKPESLLQFVSDRPGHDLRYAIDFSKTQKELGWSPKITFEQGLKRTIEWYQVNTDWVQKVLKPTCPTK